MLIPEMKDLIGSLRVHNGILIMGAGASLKAGMPLYAQFPMIMWRVIDENPVIKEEFGENKGIRARDIIGNKTDKLMEAFQYIIKYPSAIDSFKKYFKATTDKHNQTSSDVHNNICKLIHEGFIKLVISLNWDDLLEVSWTNLYGTEINGQKLQLIKPHGDVRNLDGKWTFPNEPGYLSIEHKKIISELLHDNIYTFLILGYSENDETIVEELIDPKENQNLFFRISPGNQIDLDAMDSTCILVENLVDNTKDFWQQIDYSNQNGMERALLGYRLLPSDVESSARLPQINSAHSKLKQTNYVLIEAEPGCGKSITAYQLGYDYKYENWEIFKLDNSLKEEEIPLQIFIPNRYQSLFIIDDAQQFSLSFIEKCINSANSHRKVIITRTKTRDNFSRETVTIAKKDSIDAIKEHYLKNSETLIPILNNYYTITIGNLYRDTPLERLIEFASKEETPWLFNYNLSEGWKRLQEKFSLIQEHNRSDLLLVLIAIKQILQLDKAIEYGWLRNSISSFPNITTSLDDALDFLKLEECIIQNEEGIRVLHVQLASEIVLLYCKTVNRTELKQLVEFVQNDILKSKPDFLGLVWLSNFTSRGQYEISNLLYSDKLCVELIQRCFNEPSLDSKKNALFLLDKIDRYNKDYGYSYLLNVEKNNLKFLIENISSDSLYAASNLLNNLYNFSSKEKENFVLELNFNNFFKLVESIEIDNSLGLGHFMTRVAIGMKKTWIKNFSNLLPKQNLMDIISLANVDQFWLVEDICTSIAMINSELANEFFPLMLDKLLNSFHYSVTKTLEQIDPYDMFCLFFGRQLFVKNKLKKRTKENLLELTKRIDYKDIVSAFNNSKPRDWRNLELLLYDLNRVDKKLVKKIISEINLDYIEDQLDGLWSTQPDDFYIVSLLAYARPKEIAAMLLRHKDEIEFLRPPYACLNVDLTEELLKNNKEVRLFENDRSFWDDGAETIKFCGKKQKELGMRILTQNKEKLSEIFLLIEPINWDKSFLLFSEIEKFYPDFFNQLSKDLDLPNFIKTNRIYFSDKHTGTMRYDSNRSFENVSGFKKMLNLVFHNTERQDLIKELRRILDLIVTAEKELPKKYTTISVEL
ncbi:hypothetical protein HA909_002272 [Enterococcus faecalis]|nr:hypothetical protein [Enterococcus faecalis]EGO9277677.1 hypothetical protein [Enterococcus faecalis]EIT2197006.1 hypothetical protein [Enterococcus faecalis]ELY8688003.1 hypothetical protein [Enterococcus faecalis]